MKLSFLKWVAACALACSTSVVMASDRETQTKYVGDVSYASFCKAVVNDDIRILRASLIRHTGSIGVNSREVLRRVTDTDGLKCNGKTLIDFSKSRNAEDVYAYLTAAAR